MEEQKNELINEELPEQAEKEPFVPSSKGKRILAWVLFMIVCIGTVTWLLNIAYPDWIERVKELFS